MPPLPFMAGEPTENTLFQIQKISAGGNLKKYAKGFLGGAQRGLVRARRRDLHLVSNFAQNEFELWNTKPPNV